MLRLVEGLHGAGEPVSTPCFVRTFCRGGDGNVDEGRIGCGFEMHEPMDDGFWAIRPIVYPNGLSRYAFGSALSEQSPFSPQRSPATHSGDPFRTEAPNDRPEPHQWGVCKHCRAIVLFCVRDLDAIDDALSKHRPTSCLRAASRCRP